MIWPCCTTIVPNSRFVNVTLFFSGYFFFFLEFPLKIVQLDTCLMSIGNFSFFSMGRPKLPPGEKKTPAQTSADYRAKKQEEVGAGYG